MSERWAAVWNWAEQLHNQLTAVITNWQKYVLLGGLLEHGTTVIITITITIIIIIIIIIKMIIIIIIIIIMIFLI